MPEYRGHILKNKETLDFVEGILRYKVCPYSRDDAKCGVWCVQFEYEGEIVNRNNDTNEEEIVNSIFLHCCDRRIYTK